MSGFTDFFQPTPTPPPQAIEPPGFQVLRNMLMQKIFQLQANPYGLQGQAAASPMQGQGGGQPFFSTGLNMNTPAFSGSFPTAQTSGGTPQQGNFNPAFSQLGGVRRDAAPVAGGPRAGQRVALAAMLQPRHFDSRNTVNRVPPPIMPGQNSGHMTNPNQAPLDNYGQLEAGMGGMGNLNQLLGMGWQTSNLGPQMNLPGFQYTGAQHEFGGNPWIANAAGAAGWSPTDMARWVAQGYQAQSARQGTTPGTGAAWLNPTYGHNATLPSAANNWGRPAGAVPTPYVAPLAKGTAGSTPNPSANSYDIQNQSQGYKPPTPMTQAPLPPPTGVQPGPTS